MEVWNQPIQIGSLKLKNRLVMAPVSTYGAVDGRVTGNMAEYYGLRAGTGQMGLIETEHGYVTKRGKSKAGQMSFAEDCDMESLRALAEAGHRNGGKIFVQLNHAGAASQSAVTGTPAEAPSAVCLPVKPRMGDVVPPVELTRERMGQIREDFAAAALRAKSAGFDGVEIHAAHAYLLNQFYSPLTNHRQDEYGGKLANRLRFSLEVIGAVRDAVGCDYPISVRLGGCDYMEGGSTCEDAADAAREIERAGADMISVSGGMCRYLRRGHNEPGYFLDQARAVQNVVKIPVMLTGGVRTIGQAEMLLREGVADLIGVGRAIFRNANWPEEEELEENF